MGDAKGRGRARAAAGTGRNRVDRAGAQPAVRAAQLHDRGPDLDRARVRRGGGGNRDLQLGATKVLIRVYSTRAPASAIWASALSPSPGVTSTAAIACDRTTVSKPSRRASST